VQKARLRPEDAPVTPEAISIFLEGDHFVFRVGNASAIYFSDKDTVGKSNCDGACAAIWPPVSARAGATTVGDWTVVIRTDKSSQWAYKGKPVYTFADDVAGQATGEAGHPGWHIVKP
jgi:predicted lipoprotein with Yx(FWY)xxD motif